ncbi:MAG: histidine kinase [Betaproteobacteria bacterium]|nr:histidine kinase [Betaproteobacteria bacterium]
MSIKQNAHTEPLPDFRNLGVVARVLVGVNLAALAAAFYAEPVWGEGMERFVRDATLLEPALLSTLVVLYAASPHLAGLRFPLGHAAVVCIALAIAAGVWLLAAPLISDTSPANLARALAFAGCGAAAMLAYLRLHAKAYSPALAEARLQALQARIRPHFLFNSLNAVLSLIRRDPRRAEQALEDLADLFRVLMSDGRSFVRLADEIALIERYASIESLRLGERLRMTWEIDLAPLEALLPPLVLQPLLENAIYHGVEPGTGPGEVLVRIERRANRVRVTIANPYHAEHADRHGNRMALENLRERLLLFFDAEARLETRTAGGRFELELEFPLVSDRPVGAGEGTA